MYTNQGGSKGNRSRFISKLKDHMNEEKKASHSVNAVFFLFFFETDNDDVDSSMRVLSKKNKGRNS